MHLFISVNKTYLSRQLGNLPHPHPLANRILLTNVQTLYLKPVEEQMTVHILHEIRKRYKCPVTSAVAQKPPQIHPSSEIKGTYLIMHCKDYNH